MNRIETMKKVDELKKELFALRFKSAVGQLEQPHKVKATKKEIARLLTALNADKNKEGDK